MGIILQCDIKHRAVSPTRSKPFINDLKVVLVMKTPATTREELITESYLENYDRVLRYISVRVNDIFDAENLAQDVWMRLLESGAELSEDTLTPLIYTIARNLVNDYLRRLYRRQCMHGEMPSPDSESVACASAESEIVARDLAQLEERMVETLPTQRRTIYIMSRYEEKSVDDIATELSLSFRTVENHLRLGRKDVRGFMSAIA